MRRASIQRFRSNAEGVAAVEFALVFPVLILLLMGSFDVTRAFIAHEKIKKTAYTLDQLITKAPALNANDVQKTMAATTAILAPIDASGIHIDVSYRYIDASGKISERWTQTYPKGSSPSSSSDLPKSYSDLRDVGYLSTNVRYTYSSVLSGLFFDKLEMNAQSIVRPRPGTPLSCADC